MTTIPTNIRRFNDITIKLFDKLYTAFPEGIKIEGCAIGAEATEPDAEYDEAFDTVALADFVIIWLCEEGFIRYEARDQQGYYHGVRLTLRGLTILGYLPSSVAEKKKKEPIIDRIKRYLSSGAEKATEETAKLIVGELFHQALLHWR